MIGVNSCDLSHIDAFFAYDKCISINSYLFRKIHELLGPTFVSFMVYECFIDCVC